MKNESKQIRWKSELRVVSNFGEEQIYEEFLTGKTKKGKRNLSRDPVSLLRIPSEIISTMWWGNRLDEEPTLDITIGESELSTRSKEDGTPPQIVSNLKKSNEDILKGKPKIVGRSVSMRRGVSRGKLSMKIKKATTSKEDDTSPTQIVSDLKKSNEKTQTHDIPKEKLLKFWLGTIAYQMYAIILLAIILREPRIVQSISLVLLNQVGMVAVTWLKFRKFHKKMKKFISPYHQIVFTVSKIYNEASKLYNGCIIRKTALKAALLGQSAMNPDKIVASILRQQCSITNKNIQKSNFDFIRCG